MTEFLIPWQHCIAKSAANFADGQTIYAHSINAAETARVLLNNLPDTLKQIISKDACVLAALHDTGKISPGFQKKISASLPQNKYAKIAHQFGEGYETDHTITGAAALQNYLNNRFRISDMAQIVAMHHGSIRKNIPPDDCGSIYGGKNWAAERLEFLNMMTAKYGIITDQKLSLWHKYLLAGLITTADWIASDIRFFRDTEKSVAENAEQAVRACGFVKPEFIQALKFDDIFNFKPNALQRGLIEITDSQGLYIIEAPMGSGKTEAALYAAYQLCSKGFHHGVYFGLPTRLTSNKIHERVRPFLERICVSHDFVKLAHGNAWLNAFQNGGENFQAGASWFNPRKRALLYPFAVGTIDQALLAVLRVKHNFLRTFGLAGKVVILDEIHSYDMYTSCLIETLIRDLINLNCTVIVLSATLTAQRRGRLFSQGKDVIPENAYPLITKETKHGQLKKTVEWGAERNHKIQFTDWDAPDIAADALEHVKKGECVLCIANTVAKAQAWFTAVKAEAADEGIEIGLLHSRFPGFKRDELENTWIDKLCKNGQRPDGCILIATQVVEQSVDIDADYLITELAPTDMLLQRMGRQWRHEISERKCAHAETVIITGIPDPEKSTTEIITALGKSNCMVYDPYVLMKSYLAWRHLESVNLPADIRKLIEATYNQVQDNEPPHIKELFDLHEKARKKLERLAEAGQAQFQSMPVGQDAEHAATRYNDFPSIQILIVKSIQSTGASAQLQLLSGENVQVDRFIKDIKATAAMQNNLVSVAAYWLKGHKLKTPEYLAKHFFDITPVCLWNETNGMLLLEGQKIGLYYKPELGVFRNLKEQAEKKDFSFQDDEFNDLDIFDTNRFDW